MSLIPWLDTFLLKQIVGTTINQKELDFHQDRQLARHYLFQGGQFVEKPKAKKSDMPRDTEACKASVPELDLVASIFFDMGSINDKSAALLQYIGMLIAALTFLSQSRPSVFLVIYSFAFVGCALAVLRCLNIMNPARMTLHPAENYLQEAMSELLVRRTIFFFALRCTFGLTALGIPIISLVALKVI